MLPYLLQGLVLSLHRHRQFPQFGALQAVCELQNLKIWVTSGDPHQLDETLIIDGDILLTALADRRQLDLGIRL